MAPGLQLEDFADDGAIAPGRNAPSRPAPTYEDGYADGLAAAEATFAADQAAFETGLREAIQRIDDDHTALAAVMMAALRPLHTAMLTTLLPTMLAPALIAHLRDLIETALATDLETPITIRVSDTHCQAVAAALSDSASRVAVVADPALGPHEAMLTGAGWETALDLDAALAAIAATLADAETLFLQSEKVS